jgi:ferritin-like protein
MSWTVDCSPFTVLFLGGAMVDRMMKPGEQIFDLVDVLEEDVADAGVAVEKKTKIAVVNMGLQDEILKRVTETAERVAREIIPDIAERIIREEIEKLKQS